ncbi:hypothetical protein BJV82DRAFT_637792 [Fennellomyces sp. T-0311]|nr:hypothetical protein BJV82DRAFT_637792 [Fennellomyces sp. T-0311]
MSITIHAARNFCWADKTYVQASRGAFGDPADVIQLLLDDRGGGILTTIQDLDRHDLDNRHQSSFEQMMLEEKIYRSECDSKAQQLKRRKIVAYAQFILIHDPSILQDLNWRRNEAHKTTNTLYGRLRSTHADGVHFTCMCEIPDGRVYEFNNSNSRAKWKKNIHAKKTKWTWRSQMCK